MSHNNHRWPINKHIERRATSEATSEAFDQQTSIEANNKSSMESPHQQAGLPVKDTFGLDC